MSDKETCIMCKHWSFMSGSPGYSEYTPGTDWDMGCGKKIWNTGDEYITETEFRSLINHAKTCDEYREVLEEEVQ